MKGIALIGGAVFCVVSVAGCAGLTIEPVSDATGKEARGFRYYESAPFLLVFTDNKGGLESKLLYLPDTTRKMSVRPYSYVASNDATLKFQKGLLTQAKAEVDETAVPKAAIAGLEKVASALIKAANAAPGDKLVVPAPYLFRIVRNDKGAWSLSGGQGVDGEGNPAWIRVTVQRP